MPSADTAFEVRCVLVDREGYQEIILPEAFDPEKMVGKPITLNFGPVIGRVTSAVITDQGLDVRMKITDQSVAKAIEGLEYWTPSALEDDDE